MSVPQDVPGTSTDDEDARLRAEVDAELAAEHDSCRRAGTRTAGVVLLIGAIAGWIAALALFMDKITLLEDPGASLGCDVNPFISCGTVMMTWQASAFGIPNMAVGLGGFAIMGASGALLIARASLPIWYHRAVLGGMTFAFAFVHFLAVSAIFFIRALCPWCMVVWVATAPMFFAVLAHALEEGHLSAPPPVVRVLRHWVVLTLAWYLVVAVVIALAFASQWMQMLGA
jgi:uncharacterized membrane protein